jgi:hypothetical protein
LMRAETSDLVLYIPHFGPQPSKTRPPATKITLSLRHTPYFEPRSGGAGRVAAPHLVQPEVVVGPRLIC